MNSHPVIACRALQKKYVEGKQTIEVLNHVDFTVTKAECIAIIGASGAGKSTFLQLLGGLDQPSGGQVFLQGQDIYALNERDRALLRNHQLGFIYQFHHLLPEFSALENVCMPLLIRGVTGKKAREQALSYIEKVGLLARQTHRLAELSGGERQRIAIARALVTEPSCVLADEPTGNLDQQTALEISELMMDLNQSLATSFVVVTHNSLVAKRMDKVFALKQGGLALLDGDAI